MRMPSLPLPILFIVFIFIAMFSISAGMAQTGADRFGPALLDPGRFHPRADIEGRTILSPYLMESDSALSAMNLRQPQAAAGDTTCGSTWQVTERFDALYSVAYGAGLYVAVGADGTIQTSPDGLTWTRRTSGIIDRLNGVTWSGAQFVAVGDSGTILTSPDGVTWTRRTSGTTNALSSTAWNGHQWVAVGEIILRSNCAGAITTGGASFSILNQAAGAVAYAVGLNDFGQLGAGSLPNTSAAQPHAFAFRQIYPIRESWSSRRTYATFV